MKMSQYPTRRTLCSHWDVQAVFENWKPTEFQGENGAVTP